MGKTFQEQIKTIKEQGEKQIKAIQDKRSIKSIEKFTYDINDSSIVLKEKEIYNKLTEKGKDLDKGKVNNLDKSLATNTLVFKYKGNVADKDFSIFDNALDLISKIRDGEISLSEAEDDQAKLKSSMGEIKKSTKKTFIKRE